MRCDGDQIEAAAPIVLLDAGEGPRDNDSREQISHGRQRRPDAIVHGQTERERARTERENTHASNESPPAAADPRRSLEAGNEQWVICAKAGLDSIEHPLLVVGERHFGASLR